MNKILIMVLILFLIIVGSFIFNKFSHNNEFYKKCIEYTIYDPEKRAYRWKSEFTDEWFKNKEDAMENCITTFENVLN